jgi:cellulose synthase/poly-beta-1,6-N-acetylglucosamine synthase-like glycosyltransferase
MLGAFFWTCILSILYTYLGYPLLVTLLSRARRRGGPKLPDSRTGETPPPVTLVIAAYNEEDVIASKLRNSLLLDYPREKLQILVAADGSNDMTVDIVRQFANGVIDLSYSTKRDGKMAAINRAMASARGDIVVFSDANNFYESRTIRELVHRFGDPTVGAVTGAKSITNGDGALGESEGLYWKYESFIREQESHLGNCTGVVGEVLAIRRDLYEPPPEMVINDDFYLAMRMIRRGYRVVYEPEARSFERISLSEQDEITRRTRINAGRYQALAHAGHLLPWDKPLVVWQVISHKFMRLVVPFAMIGALFANLALVIHPPDGNDSRRLGAVFKLSHPWNALFLVLQAVFYALAFTGSRLHTKGRIGKALYLPTFLVNSNLAALKGFLKYVSGRQSNRWQRVQRRATDMKALDQ